MLSNECPNFFTFHFSRSFILAVPDKLENFKGSKNVYRNVYFREEGSNFSPVTKALTKNVPSAPTIDSCCLTGISHTVLSALKPYKKF